MKFKLFFIAVVFGLLISCKSEEFPEPQPDIELETAKKEIVGTWKEVFTLVWKNTKDYKAYTVNIKCDVMQSDEWAIDIIKSIDVDSSLNVTKHFYCSPDKTSKYEIIRENTKLYLIETDENGQIMKGFVEFPLFEDKVFHVTAIKDDIRQSDFINRNDPNIKVFKFETQFAQKRK